MTTIFVLPTADLVREYHHLDALFVFHDEGIKGVLREAVLASKGWVIGKPLHDVESSLKPLLDKVLRVYDNSQEAMLQRLMENTSAEYYVEMVVMDLYHRVSRMMHDLFRDLEYDISPVEHKWLGNDLMAVVRIL